MKGVGEDMKSLPVRGAWIEIRIADYRITSFVGRSPCGGRGLKYKLPCIRYNTPPVAPRAGGVD